MANVEKEVKWDGSSKGAFVSFVRALAEVCGPLEKPKNLSITDRYLDDDSGSFSSQKIALRIRRTGAEYEATLKTRTQLVNGVARREEYTLALPDARSFSGALKELAAHKHWHGLNVENLQVRFTLRNCRRTYAVRFAACLCEAALDRYVISARSKTLKQREIELELKSGPEEDFLKLTEELSSRCALARAQISKVASAEKLLCD